MDTKVSTLSQDLDVLEAMTAEMADYLDSNVLYWNMVKGNMPKLTLGGYLMREHRLTHLTALLNEQEQKRLTAALQAYKEAAAERVVRFETHAHEELGVRSRQWGSYIEDLHRDGVRVGVNYKTAVENRAMLEALVDRLETPPYQLNRAAYGNLAMMDQGLKPYWKKDGFVWPEEWQPAYPQAKYWWLYGNIG